MLKGLIVLIVRVPKYLSALSAWPPQVPKYPSAF